MKRFGKSHWHDINASTENGKGKNQRARKIGQQSKKVALTALKELKEKKRIRGFNYKNANGITFIIFLLSDKVGFLRIKSSERWLIKHREKYPDIPIVVIHHHYPNLSSPKRAKLFKRLVHRTKLQIQNILQISQ